MTTLVRKELIRSTTPTFPEDEGFRFRHLLIRDAAYDSLPKATRAELHERFADWLAAHDLVEGDEIVGYHLEQAHRYRAELDDARPGAAGTRARASDRSRRSRARRARPRRLQCGGRAPAKSSSDPSSQQTRGVSASRRICARARRVRRALPRPERCSRRSSERLDPSPAALGWSWSRRARLHAGGPIGIERTCARRGSRRGSRGSRGGRQRRRARPLLVERRRAKLVLACSPPRPQPPVSSGLPTSRERRDPPRDPTISVWLISLGYSSGRLPSERPSSGSKALRRSRSSARLRRRGRSDDASRRSARDARVTSSTRASLRSWRDVYSYFDAGLDMTAGGVTMRERGRRAPRGDLAAREEASLRTGLELLERIGDRDLPIQRAACSSRICLYGQESLRRGRVSSR